MGYDLNKYAGSSKWLKAADLTDLDMDSAIVTICEVYEDQFEARDGKPAEDKLCLKFKEFDKPFGMNVTNTKSCQEILGADTDTWEGRKVKLRVSTANNPQTGKPVDCLRIVAAPQKKSPVQDAAMASAKAKPKPADEEDDAFADE